MELGKGQWYVRWFFWSLAVWDEFRERDSSWRYRNGTNLCHFIRVIFVWAPLALALNAVVYGSAIAAFTAAPIYFYGFISYAWIVGAVVFVVGLILAIKFIGGWMSTLKWDRPMKQKPARPEKPARASAGPGFFRILWEYIVAVKKKFCPTITFNSQQEPAQ